MISFRVSGRFESSIYWVGRREKQRKNSRREPSNMSNSKKTVNSSFVRNSEIWQLDLFKSIRFALSLHCNITTGATGPTTHHKPCRPSLEKPGFSKFRCKLRAHTWRNLGKKHYLMNGAWSNELIKSDLRSPSAVALFLFKQISKYNI